MVGVYTNKEINNLELSPLELAKLTYGNNGIKSIMSEEEFKARNEVVTNFMEYFKISIKTE